MLQAQPLQGTHADIRRVALLQQSMASELQELLQTSKSSWEGHQASIDGLYATVLQLRSQQGTDSHAIKQAVQTSATSTTAATHMQQAALLKSIQVGWFRVVGGNGSTVGQALLRKGVHAQR